MRPVQRGETYGRGVVVIEEPTGPDGRSVMASLLGLLRAPGYAPPVRPTVALDLLELVKRDDTSAEAVVALLERDMVVAGRVLQLAGSPVYSAGQPARTLRDAIVRLGTRTMAEILFQVWTTTKVFRAPGYERPMDELRLHSTAVAHIARIVSRRTAHHDEYAFLCGLLHDVGVALALIAVAETSPRGAAPPFEELAPALAEMHEQGAAILCEAWRLPDDVRMVVANHHHPVVCGRVHPVIAALRVSEEIAVELGLPGVDQPSDERSMREALGLGPAVIDAIVAEARVALEPLLDEAAALRGAPPPRPSLAPSSRGSVAPPALARVPTAPKLPPLAPLGRAPTQPGAFARSPTSPNGVPVRSPTSPGGVPVRSPTSPGGVPVRSPTSPNGVPARTAAQPGPFARTPTQPNPVHVRAPTSPNGAPARTPSVIPPPPRSTPGAASPMR